jgi:hypothetical protein
MNKPLSPITAMNIPEKSTHLPLKEEIHDITTDAKSAGDSNAISLVQDEIFEVKRVQFSWIAI